jgi:hypothetical protein
MKRPVLEQPANISTCDPSDLERLKQNLRVAQRQGLVQPFLDPALDGVDDEEEKS